MKYIGIIPARYASTRFPAKPLAMLGGKTVIERVYEQVSGVLDDAWVATDDERIADAVRAFGGRVVMTSVHHKSGTDRCREAFENIGQPFDVVVNIQDTGNRWFPAQNWLTGTTDWIRQSFEFTAAKGTNTGKQKAKISLVIYNARGTAWFDDVKIEEI